MLPPKAKPPKCADCGASKPHAVLRRGFTCEFKRAHPDAAPYVPLPHERRPAKLQTETLF